MTDTPMSQLWCDGCDEIVRLCDTDGYYTSEMRSDYERFWAFCHCYTLLENTDTAQAFEAYVRTLTGYGGGIDGSIAPLLWESAVCGLPVAADLPVQASEKPLGRKPILLPFDCLLEGVTSIATAHEDFGRMLEKSEEDGVMADATALRFCRPDAYHAERIGNGREDEGDRSLLQAWLLGSLCRALRRTGKCLYLTVGEGSDVMQTLRYWRQRRILPDTVLCLTEQTDLGQISSQDLGYIKMGRGGSFVRLELSRIPEEKRQALSRWYPMGMAFL